MIQEFVDRFMESKSELRSFFAEKHPENYLDIVRAVVRECGKKRTESDRWERRMNHERIHVIDDGCYHGALVFVIGDETMDCSNYWYVMADYGSCSGCDTLLAIREDYSTDSKPTEKEVDDYMTLALHIVQRIKKMEADQ